MSFAAEIMGLYFTPKRLDLGLLQNGEPVGVRAAPTWTVMDSRARIEHEFVFTQPVRFNAVGFYDGRRLVDIDDVPERSLVPGDRWTYSFDMSATTVRLAP